MIICSSPSKVSRATPERLRLGADFCPETAMGSALSSTIEFHSPQAEHLPAHCEVTLPHFWQIYVAFLGMVWVSLFCASDDFFRGLQVAHMQPAFKNSRFFSLTGYGLFSLTGYGLFSLTAIPRCARASEGRLVVCALVAH